MLIICKEVQKCYILKISRDIKTHIKVYRPSSFLKSSALSVFSHVKSASSLPKWPYAAVFEYMGRLKSSSFIIAAGLKSKILRTAATIFSFSTFEVEKVSISISTETGELTPIAYAS